jgi:hypothetical protein
MMAVLADVMIVLADVMAVLAGVMMGHGDDRHLVPTGDVMATGGVVPAGGVMATGGVVPAGGVMMASGAVVSLGSREDGRLTEDSAGCHCVSEAGVQGESLLQPIDARAELVSLVHRPCSPQAGCSVRAQSRPQRVHGGRESRGSEDVWQGDRGSPGRATIP